MFGLQEVLLVLHCLQDSQEILDPPMQLIKLLLQQHMAGFR